MRELRLGECSDFHGATQHGLMGQDRARSVIGTLGGSLGLRVYADGP